MGSPFFPEFSHRGKALAAHSLRIEKQLFCGHKAAILRLDKGAPFVRARNASDFLARQSAKKSREKFLKK
jgi:hypothetical protein